MMQPQAADYLNELASIGNYLSAAQEILKSGYMPDITGLEKTDRDFVCSITKRAKRHPKRMPSSCFNIKTVRQAFFFGCLWRVCNAAHKISIRFSRPVMSGI